MFVQRERARLDGEREAIFTQQQELEHKLADINRELSAIDAYESAKTGKAAPPRRAAARRGQPRARSGSKREQLLEVIRAGGGLSRGEILD
ncbi:MAG TPA: hypothetical protein VND95_16750, partial [Stellaceae bacterium]|nr:hypothetical protein [Stellaceae bacterium]